MNNTDLTSACTCMALPEGESGTRSGCLSCRQLCKVSAIAQQGKQPVANGRHHHAGCRVLG